MILAYGADGQQLIGIPSKNGLEEWFEVVIFDPQAGSQAAFIWAQPRRLLNEVKVRQLPIGPLIR
jgi:hypothetical protein